MHLLKHWPGRRKIVCVLKEFGLFMEQRLHITKANCAKAAGVVWKISPQRESVAEQFAQGKL